MLKYNIRARPHAPSNSHLRSRNRLGNPAKIFLELPGAGAAVTQLVP